MKSPDAQKVKTRLRTAFSKEEIRRLYEAFVQDALEKLMAFSCDVKVICYLGNPPSKDFISSKGGKIEFWPQRGSGLGERMKNYFDWSFSQGAGKSIVIGSDSPTLPTAYLKEAFSLLDLYEVVIGPSLDGGYYLIGMKTLHPELFDRIPWSRASVFQKTLFQNRHLEGKLALLRPWYDVDTLESLFLLKRHLCQGWHHAKGEFPRRTHRILSELKMECAMPRSQGTCP